MVHDSLQTILKQAENLETPITIMEVCGSHTNVIMKYGIRELLPKNIRLISGPGCPVCVSSQHDIDCVIALAHQGVPIATYGDMLKVPGSSSCLEKERTQRGNVFEVYSTTEVLQLKEDYPNIVFFGIGFETTAPMTAYLLKHHVCVYSVHKIIPPAIQILTKGNVKIDGFLNPGHVSTIIGVQPYQTIKIPQVIAGFSPMNILGAISILINLINDKKTVVVNGYPEAVREKGNIFAQRMIRQHFYVGDCEWRGLGILPLSGLEVINDALNAKKVHADILKTVKTSKKTKCRCGEVLKGLIDPSGCPLYKKICTPNNPQGACMVSAEGSCAIYYRYGK